MSVNNLGKNYRIIPRTLAQFGSVNVVKLQASIKVMTPRLATEDQ